MTLESERDNHSCAAVSASPAFPQVSFGDSYAFSQTAPYIITLNANQTPANAVSNRLRDEPLASVDPVAGRAGADRASQGNCAREKFPARHRTDGDGRRRALREVDRDTWLRKVWIGNRRSLCVRLPKTLSASYPAYSDGSQGLWPPEGHSMRFEERRQSFSIASTKLVNGHIFANLVKDQPSTQQGTQQPPNTP